MTTGPMQRYRALINQGEIHADPAQRLAVEKLQILHMRLADYNPAQGKQVQRGWFGWVKGSPQKVIALTGFYVFGGVGRGKSMLMDLFYDGAPVTPKRRVHFHAFMQEVQVGIQIARESNVTDPIKTVADEVAEGATLLCFDEFQVTDIADAMILGRLFEALFDHGVVVVATSNRPPDDLYKDGLNRQVFLPFIAMLKERLDVHELESETDYRQGREEGEAVYFSPLGAPARAAMDAAWDEVTGGDPGTALTISIRGRRIVIRQAAEEVGRASFADLCEAPLGPADYLAIAEQFATFFLDDVPVLSRARNNEAKRFVTLIDTFYEAKTRFYCSAAAEPEDLYVTGAGSFEFARTASRLEEMQAASWPDGGDGGEA
ncbi:MAG: cell division protein ZapE [Pseudomonadota bacterium]